jgi:hypothetical protein
MFGALWIDGFDRRETHREGQMGKPLRFRSAATHRIEAESAGETEETQECEWFFV